MSRGAIILVSIFGVLFLAGLAKGSVVLPGLIAILVFRDMTKPKTVLSATDTGLVQHRTSWINGAPTEVLARVPWQALSFRSDKEIALADEVFAVKRSDAKRLRKAAEETYARFVGNQPPAAR